VWLYFQTTLSRGNQKNAHKPTRYNFAGVRGTTENAVRIQIYSAIINYCMVAIVGHDLKLERSTYEILTVPGISLLDKTPIKELFGKTDNEYRI